MEEVFNGTEILPVSCGIVTIVHDFLGRDQIDFDIEMPEQIIMLDARYQGKDETYFRVAQRYQDILTRLYRFKFEKVYAPNTVFLESEMKTLKDTLKRKKSIENDDCEEPMAKIAHRDEECDGKKSGKESKRNEIVTESESVEESIGKLSSSVHTQNETRVNHLLKKRSINAEDDSTDSEEPFSKRARLLSSETSTDIEDVEKNEESNLCENLENIKKIPSKDTPESFEPLRELKQQVNEEASSSSTINVAAVPRRVNEIIRNVPFETSHLLSPYNKLSDISDIQKKYTRIDMLKMREELNNLTVTDSTHAHEYFVVNSFKMFYSLNTSSSSSVPSNEIEDFKNYSIPSQLIPLKLDTVNDLLNELKRIAIFPKNGISYMDYKNEMMTKKKKIAVEWEYVDAVYKFVQEKKEIGVCSQELLDKFFDEQGTNLYKVVSLLTDNHIFLRSGVTNPRYIHHRYVDPWLIQSCKLNRHEQESMVPFKNSVYATMQQKKTTAESSNEIDAKQNRENTDTENAVPSTSSDNRKIEEKKEKEDMETENAIPSTLSNNRDTKEKKNRENTETKNAIPSTSSDGRETEEKKDEKADNENEKEECNESEGDTRMKRRIHKQRTRLISQGDVYKSAQQFDLSTAKEIKVVIKPWIRIDGGLNRKVLDRMLGTVLSYCLLHPGLTMVKMQNRFVPALQPFHTHELVEILIKLGCLESKHLKKTRVTLFSRPSTIQINKITADTIGWFAEDEIILEPAVDAVTKFSIFLSTRKYTSDFIS